MNYIINLLFIVHGLGIGGTQQANVLMINKIDRSKFNIHVLYFKHGELYNNIDKSQISINKMDDYLKITSIKNLSHLLKIINYIKKHNINIVHTMDPVAYILGSIASHYTKTRHVRTQPNFIRRHEKLNTKTLKLLPFEKWTDKFITYQYGSAKDLILAGVNSEKIETIRGLSSIKEFLDYQITSDIREEFNISKDDRIILAIHRMVLKKGYETFIDMIPYVIKEYPNVTFLLVGDGPLKRSFEERVKRLGVINNVRFTGFQKNIVNIIKQIDFGVYPLADTAGMVSVIKAGKVLITKRDSSMDEYIIDGETGYLVPEDKPEIYAEYSLKLLNNPILLKEMEEKQKQHVLNNFDSTNNIRRLEELFISLYRSGIQNKKR